MLKKFQWNNGNLTFGKLACRYLKRMKKLGGKDKAVETVALLRAKYPQRRALMEELNQLG